MSPSDPDVPSRADAATITDSSGGAAVARPGWPEILAGVAVCLLLVFGVLPLIRDSGLDPLAYGLVVVAWSGVAGIAGATAARTLRVRSWTAFGVRRTSWRWLAGGVLAGVAAWLLSRVATLGYIALTGDTGNVQQIYSDTGAAGPVSLILSLLFLCLLTPIGEELLFRGVVATALLRYGSFVGVVGSAVVFAAVHGANAAAVTALVVGLITGELLRRSGSIWPGVVVHTVNNLIGYGVSLLLAIAA